MLKSTFIELATAKFGDRFDYSHLPDLIKRKSEVVVCNKHGKINVIPRDHLKAKYGCPRCRSESTPVSNYIKNKSRLKKAVAKFGNKFDYSKVDLSISPESPNNVICPIHGQIKVSLRSHSLTETGCKKCGIKLRANRCVKYGDLQKMIPLFRAVQEDEYIYLRYDIGSSKLIFKCPKHGIIKQKIHAHLAGMKCRKCDYESRRITKEIFMDRIKSVHPVGYSYDLSTLVVIDSWITISHDCGHTYKARASNHLNGQGCIKCKSSLGEKKVGQWLTDVGIEHVVQFKIPGYIYRYDFYLPRLRILIEYDGPQHHRPIEFFGGEKAFKRRKYLDNLKTDIARAHGYHLIRVPYTEFSTLEIYLSRAIGKLYMYNVDGVYYSNFMAMAEDMKIPKDDLVSEYNDRLTVNVLARLASNG